MINKLFGAAAAIALAISPAAARVEDGTYALMQLIDTNGIPVTVNGAECDDDQYLGIYIHRGMQRKMVLCPGEAVDPIDHAVVRHEAWHAIQHCVNVVRGTSVSTPVNTDVDQLMHHVNANLPEHHIQAVVENYPREQWLLELEAYVAMEVLTADEIAELFKQVCVADF